jgi:hypothetical protein
MSTTKPYKTKVGDNQTHPYQEEEAWTEEYFAQQDCGYVEGEPPTYQWVLSSHQFNNHIVDPLFTFCKEGYAKLYLKWLQQLNPTTSFSISKVVNNPQKPKELQTK